MPPWLRDSLRMLVAGAVIGLLVLGLGGRVAMAAIQFRNAGDSNWSVGGTLTVVFLGGVSGLAGAAIALFCEWLGARLKTSAWVSDALVALLLLLVTMRGLRGTAPIGALYFYPLVGVYAALLVFFRRRLRARAAQRTSTRIGA